MIILVSIDWGPKADKKLLGFLWNQGHKYKAHTQIVEAAPVTFCFNLPIIWFLYDSFYSFGALCKLSKPLI